ncbi:MAG: DNA cytosine methyltransferase, partial [Planctomycetes bacterium]|nr:DNA cytosine methyltransferase [Planctomycetota bacterium]
MFFDEGKPGSGIARTKGLAEVIQIVKLHVRRLRGAVVRSSKYAYSAVSLFAGCGGSDLGLRLARIDPIWANEKNESACQIFERVTGS